MADRLEIAHHTPSRTRLRWQGEGDPSTALLGAIAGAPAVYGIDYRPATGSVVLAHDRGFGIDDLATLATPFSVAVSREEIVAQRPLRAKNGAKGARAIGRRPNPVQPGPDPVRPGTADEGKWAPIVADVEAVVLLGLIFGWIRDWFAGQSPALGTIILVILSAIGLFAYWWRRRRHAESSEPELEFIYA